MRLPGRRQPRAEGTRRWPDFYNFVTALLVVALIVGVLDLIPANSYVFTPGQALRVEPMIKIRGHRVFHPAGKLYMTDVTVYKADHLLEELYGRVNPDADVEPAQSVSGGLSQNQYLQLNSQLMNDSIQQAEAAALSVSRGFKLRYRVIGPQVVVILPGTPAASKLTPGDIVRAVSGHSVKHASEVSPLVQAVGPGRQVALTVQRGRRVLTVKVRTIAATGTRPDRHGKRALIGVQLQDKTVFVFPVQISINRGGIVGPSAGLMFTLGIVEQLERRDLTRGCAIAGTGTIDYRGEVGAIGGAKQKIIAASRVGARYFLVPNVPDNAGPARANRRGVTVVPISTLQQAMAFFQRLTPCR